MRKTIIHPLWLRLTHWINVVAILVMITSGWQIYDASPVFHAIRFPDAITLGGWLGGALLWHFAFMWLLAGNLLVYGLVNLCSGRLRRKMFPLSPRMVLHDLCAALRGRQSRHDPAHYNAVQKLAYLAVLADLVLLILSGLAVWKSVQFPLLRELMGGYDNTRVVHFCAMAFLVLFLLVHLAMVALVPRSLRAIIQGH